MAKAIWQNTTIAESNETQMVEGNHYFPPGSVKREFLEESSHTTTCPWKGTAHYFHVNANGMKNENAAWYYPEPKSAAANIKDHLAFWKGIQVSG